MKRIPRKQLLPDRTRFRGLFEGFSILLRRLSSVKDSYAHALTILEDVRDVLPEQERKEIEATILGTKNVYIGTDRAIETITAIQYAMTLLAPGNFVGRVT